MARGYGDEMSRERWREDQRERPNYGRDRDEDRGFFERAGDQLRSWFGEDEGDRGPGRDYLRDTSRNRDREGGYGRVGGEYDDRRRFGRTGRFVSGWESDQGRGGYGTVRAGGSWREPSGPHDFGGFRDESDFRGSHRRGPPRSWREANRGENESLGYGDFRGTLGGFGNQTIGSSQDDFYRNWRDREMAKLDRDYDDYCREREHQFNQDFDSWRRSRLSQSPSAMTETASPDLGAASNAGVGTTNASLSGTAGTGSAVASATGAGGSIQSDTTGSTEKAGTGAERPGSRSRT